MAEAKDFRKANGALDGSKFEATVWSNVDSGNNSNNQHKVVGILDVEGEPNALELLVDKPMIDNTTIKVEFKDKRTNSVIESSNTVYCKLTDGYQPSALKVNVKDNRTLEVEFSEAVLRGSDVEGTGNAQYAADSLLNYAIDAKKIENYGVKTTKVEDGDVEDSAVYRISYKDTTEDDGNKAGSIRVGTYSNAVDQRHIVTIKLGEGYALSSGDHSLAISNVGDWAASTDGWRNILNTATLNFHVPENTEAPKFDLEVMSPEQYKLTANCDFSVLSGKTFKTANSSTAKNEVVIKLQQYIGNDWVDISKDATTEDTVGDGRNPIMVSQIMDASGQPTREYLVETTKDWTKVHDTKSSHKSYYNNRYRLHIDAGQLKSLANDKTNDAINIELSNDPMMQRIDDTNLNITSIEQVQDKDGNLTKDYRVTFNKPIKMNDNANKEGMTPTQDVNAGTMYSAYFIKRDASQTSIPAKIATDSFVDAVDTILQVQPTEDLTAGEWDLYVRGVADDYGNTAPTLSGVITVDTKEVVSDFKVVWAAVSTSPSYEDITEGEGHYIFVKFNQPINVSGSTSTNVAATLNYQINGKSLPTGSNIISGIKGYDDDSDGVTDSITIELPQGNNSSLGGNTMNYPVNGSRAILTISNSVTNKNGAQLVTEPGYNLPYQYGEAPNFGLSEAGDAVWGNAASEKAASTGYTSKDAYISALKSALANEKYRKVKFDRNIPNEWLTDGFLDVGDLNINRIVDLDLNGINILGNIKINSKDQADELVIENSYSGKNVTVKGKSDTEKSATLTINTPNTDVTINQDITFEKGNSSINWQINGVPSGTLLNYATVKDGDVVLAGNGIGFRNMGSLTDANIIVDTTGTVYLKGGFTGASIVLEKKVTLDLAELSSAVEVIVKAAESTVKVLDDTQDVKITAEAKDVLIKTDNDSKIKLQTDGEGSFKQEDLSGNANDVKDPTPIGAQDWINKLTVIDGSTAGDTLVEVITASSASASAITFTHGGKENLVDALKAETGTEGNVSYEITGVNISTNGSNLTYDSAKGSVTCSTSNSSTATATHVITFKFTVKVTEDGVNTVKVVTKKVNVKVPGKSA